MATLVPRRQPGTLEPRAVRDPFRAMREEMDDLVHRFFGDWSTDTGALAFSPDIDLSETPTSLIVHMDLPGVKPENIDIEVVGNTLRIHGERMEEKREKEHAYIRTERRTGTFTRTLTLPCAVQEDKIEALDRDGILTITLPKTEAAKARKIKVKGG